MPEQTHQDTDPHELEYCSECSHCTGRSKPLPHDADAERRVAYGLLEYYSWQAFEPMLSDWFYSWLPKVIVQNIVAIQKDGPAKSIEHVCEVLYAQGFHGPLEREVQHLCDCTPYRGLDEAKKDLATIKELWRTRRVIAWLETYCVELRAGTRTGSQVLESIERMRGEF